MQVPTVKDCLSRFRDVFITHFETDISRKTSDVKKLIKYPFVTNMTFSKLENISAIYLSANSWDFWHYSDNNESVYIRNGMENKDHIIKKVDKNCVVCDIWKDLDALPLINVYYSIITLDLIPKDESTPFSVHFSCDKLGANNFLYYTTQNSTYSNFGTFDQIFSPVFHLSLKEDNILPRPKNYKDLYDLPIYHRDMSSLLYISNFNDPLEWLYVHYYGIIQRWYRRRKLEKFIAYYYSTKHANKLYIRKDPYLQSK